MLVLRLETDHPAERFEELIRGIDNEFKVELSDDICFFFGDLGGRILVGAAGHQLLDLRNLVSFLKLSSNVESSHSHQLQFTQRHFFHGQVLVNDGSDREQRLREHLVFVMQFTEPVDQLGPRLFRDCLMTGDVVMQSVGLLLSTLHELQVLRKVFWDHLRVVNIELDLNGLNLNMGPIIAGGDIALLGIQGKVSESICMKKGIIPLGFLVVKRIKISDVVTKGSRVHVSVRLIYYNCHGDNFIMRYNQLTYHKASPFYKQDFLPDRAWFNRKPKDFPSQIPTGQDYFVDSGRKHFTNHFNHSEIASKAVLESPERYPFENRIALDKTYMRNLDTIDIEGAASGTRINQSIKNKLKAQEELARRYNQSLDMREHKDKTYEQKRREIALKQFETLQERKAHNEALANSRLSQNNQPPRQQQDISPEKYQPYYVDSNNYGKKYINLIPKPYYAHLEAKPQNEHGNRPQRSSSMKQPENTPQENYERMEKMNPQEKYEETQQKKGQIMQSSDEAQYPLSMNNRHRSNPEYNNAYDADWKRKREDYLKNVETEEAARHRLQDKREFRKYNPTNLSFNLAAQSIVGNNH